jgi:hypothetical protein
MGLTIDLVVPRPSTVIGVSQAASMGILKSLYLLIFFLIISFGVVGESNAAFETSTYAAELCHSESFDRFNLTLTLLPQSPAYHSNSKPSETMQYLITLHLQPPNNSLQYVKQLSGIRELEIDENYGLVPIAPKRDLYVIRVCGDLDPNQLMSIQPAVKGVHGDVKVEPFNF